MRKCCWSKCAPSSACKARCQSTSIRLAKEQPSLAFHDRFERPSGCKCNRRTTRGRCFERHESEIFNARYDERLCAADETAARDVINKPHEVNRRTRNAAKSTLVWPATCDEKFCGQEIAGFNRKLNAFVRQQPAHHDIVITGRIGNVESADVCWTVHDVACSCRR